MSDAKEKWIIIGTLVGILAGYLGGSIRPLPNFEPSTWEIFSILNTITIDTWAAFAGTLIGSAIVVASAFIVLSKQEKLRQHATSRGRRSQQLAARAMLSMDLSTLCKYTEGCADLTRKSLASPVKLVADTISPPVLDPAVLERLTRLVELLDGDDVHKIVDLINCIQVQHARFESVISFDPSDTMNLDSSLISIVELRLRAESMFRFSRQEEEQIPPPPYSQKQVDTALLNLNLFDSLLDTTKNSIFSAMENLSPIGPSMEN